MIHVGFSKGSSVNIPLQHTIVSCITRYGKTTTLKRMVKSLPSEYKVLFIDVKRPRDYEGLGTEVPIYLEDRTEPVGLKNLLEASGKMGLKFEFSELIKVCKQLAAEDEEGRYGFVDVYTGVSKALKEKMHPIRESKLLVLQHLLGRVVKDLDKIEIAGELNLPGRYNVMNLSGQRRMIQNIAVYSTIKWILEKLDHTVIVLDELPDFAPQGHGTPAKDVIIEAVRKGGASEIWLWLAGQTITGVDKEVLKECNYWILGRQREKNEAQRVLDQIPFKIPGGLNYRDIMTLRVGHAVVVSEEGAYVTYVQHPGIDEETARKVSLGTFTVNEVIQMLKKGKESDEEMWKEKFEELKKAHDSLLAVKEGLEQRLEKVEKEFTRQVERLSDLKAEEKVKVLREQNEEMRRANLDKYHGELEKAKNHIKLLDAKVTDLKGHTEEMASELKLYDEFRSVLRRMLPQQRKPGFEPGADVPSEVSVSVEQPALILKKKTEPLELSQEDLIGRIAIVYAEGMLPPKKAFSLRQLLMIMEKRFGHKEAYPNLSKPLMELVAWGYLEKVKAGTRWDYRVKLSPKEAREKGLLKESVE